MIPNKIFYTNGRDVTVTSSDLRVKNTLYKLNGIVGHGLMKLKANRMPGLILFILGGLLLVLGWIDFFPSSMDFRMGDTVMLSNVVASWVGIAFAVAGAILLLVERERYAVRIATAEGEKNVIVSSKKEYVSQVIDALNEAYRQVEFHAGYTRNRTTQIGVG